MQTTKQGMWTVGYRETHYVTHYVTHYFKQSCGWIKCGEFAFATGEQAERFISDTLARYPQDDAKFERRVA
jgi:hypothetical protein